MCLWADLPQGFIQHDTRAHCQIEAADMGIAHGDRQAAVTIQRENVFRQAFCLLAKDQHGAGSKPRLCIGSGCFCGQKKETALVLTTQKGLEILPVVDPDLGPVIKPGPFAMI